MHITYNKTEDSHLISDCQWIKNEIKTDFGSEREACCESMAHITHIATLSGRNDSPVNQYSVEIMQDFGFGREYIYRVYKVGQNCEWKDIREGFFNELLGYAKR